MKMEKKLWKKREKNKFVDFFFFFIEKDNPFFLNHSFFLFYATGESFLLHLILSLW